MLDENSSVGSLPMFFFPVLRTSPQSHPSQDGRGACRDHAEDQERAGDTRGGTTGWSIRLYNMYCMLGCFQIESCVLV